MERKFKARGESAIFLLVFAVILIIVNVLSVKWFARADLTARRVHSLSQASLDVVGRLKDKLVVKAYFTEDLPPPFGYTRRSELVVPKVAEDETALIRNALARAAGDRTRAAAILGISRSTLWRRMRALKLLQRESA